MLLHTLHHGVRCIIMRYIKVHYAYYRYTVPDHVISDLIQHVVLPPSRSEPRSEIIDVIHMRKLNILLLIPLFPLTI